MKLLGNYQLISVRFGCRMHSMDVHLLSFWDRRGCPQPCSRPPCIAWQCSAPLNRPHSLSQQQWISQQEASHQLTVSLQFLPTLNITTQFWLFFAVPKLESLATFAATWAPFFPNTMCSCAVHNARWQSQQVACLPALGLPLSRPFFLQDAQTT